jgi:hypothetical protein
MLKRIKQIEPAKVLFGISCLFVVFGYGLAVGRYQVFPFSILKAGQDSILQVFEEREMLLGIRPTDFLSPIRYDGNGVVTHESARAVPGLTLLTGFFDDQNEMRLLRLDGSIVNRWPVRFSEIFPEPEFIEPVEDRPQSDWNTSVHGSLLLDDGSLIFNFGLGTAKLDRCGVVEWTVPRMTHHSVARAESGGFWIPSRRYVDDQPQFPRLETPYYEDTILKVSENGEVLSELSVLEILYRNNLEGFMFGRRYRTGDLTHLNDVEELSSEMADAFPMFAAGDLVISLRMEHLVLVVDPETLDVKWYRAGPWLGQHDPDFQADGSITIFSNNDDLTPTGEVLGGSTIIEIDPETGRIEYLYGTRPEQRAFTASMGKHQVVGDEERHILFTESKPGRVFEVDAQGRIVWEFVNRYDDLDASLITGAIRYPEDYFTFDDWTCE